ncbi:MAG: chemotaxis response regulator protein-glutamate methylesterase [Verrucomicrobiota bacterium]
MSSIRVLVVDDAVVMQQILTEVLGSDPDITVSGAVPNGRLALMQIPRVKPDIVTLDIEMPEMDGLETLKEIRKHYPKLPVIMLSALTEKGGETTLNALASGASDYVTKPEKVNNIMECIERLTTELIPKIKTLCSSVPAKNLPTISSKARSLVSSRLNTCSIKGLSIPRIVAIGSSTGGPNALAQIFKTMPQNIEVPIVIVQHMPPMFTKILAERLDGESKFSIKEAEDGEKLLPNHAYLAPGGFHMGLKNSGSDVFIALNQNPQENSCRPAVDVLFRDVARIFGQNVLGVVLTGMGQDGLCGSEVICENGGKIIVQDKETSVVWGMPGCIAEANLADNIISIDKVNEEILKRLKWREMVA